jgi:hypothetical protein
MPKKVTFDSWYADIADRFGLDPDPDSPMHQYDYRAAFSAGVNPGEDGHWPSTFKKAGHPTLIKEIDGNLINTKTGNAASFTEMLGNLSYGRHVMARAEIEQARGKRTKGI